jgi:hypothetical protein
MQHRHEIKGAAFLTLARYVAAEHGAPTLARLVDAMPAGERSVLEQPLASTWHPEDTHQRMLHAIFDLVAAGRLDRFEDLIARCTLRGVESFASLVLGMASPAFVLRRAPTLWGVIRRGPATLSVTQEGEVTIVSYRGFPYMGDELYRSYFVALLGALTRPSLGRTPPTKVAAHGDDWLDIRIDLSRRTAG